MGHVLSALLLLAGAALCAWPLGRYLARVLAPPRSRPDAVDQAVRALLGPAALEEQGWKGYTLALLVSNAVFFLAALLILGLQQHLPLNPDGKGALEWSLLLHTVTSFVTNTNLQHYSGEQALSYASQMLGLTWLQFVSAATGIGAMAALARGLAGKGFGNFYRDLVRVVLLVLLPLSLVVASLLVVEGTPMTPEGAARVETVEGRPQRIARGPVAAMVAIKQLGTNGGGYYGPNSTHPLENPTALTALLQHVAVLLLPMACVFAFGELLGRRRHAAVIFGAMTVLYLSCVIPAVLLEERPNPGLAGLPVAEGLGNMEGKEVRLGPWFGAAWAVSTTATSNGSVAAMHDSLNPLTGLAPMVGMWTNVTYGGVGVGMINMFLYVILAVFVSGLMVGRTPEYLSRKVEAGEMKLAVLAVLLPPLLILGGTALFLATGWAAATITNPGSHGLAQVLYEMSSAAANNGSGFEGLGDDTVPWNLFTALAMLLGRYLPIVLPLAIAGSLAAKRPTPETVGTLRVDALLFGVLLLGAVVLLGALLFLPAAVLGPIAEHLTMGGAS